MFALREEREGHVERVPVACYGKATCDLMRQHRAVFKVRLSTWFDTHIYGVHAHLCVNLCPQRRSPYATPYFRVTHR